MCAVVCPFDVLTFHPMPEGPSPDVAVAVKCDGCVDRVSRGDSPACVEVCKVDALVFGELNNLVAEGRVHEAGVVLAAAGAAATVPAGDPLAPWHAWGAAEVAAASAAAARARRASNNANRHAVGAALAEVENEGGPR
jgi:Fe-S-cluster-containing dehydrogenase component